MTVRVFNAGIAGDTTRELLARFNRDVAVRAPGLVILWAGVNDRLYPGHTIELPEFEENYRELLERIETIGAKVLVGTLPPQFVPYLAERLAPVNAFLRALGLPLADFEAVVKSRPVGEERESFLRNPANSGVRDGLHLTEAGTEAVAQCAAAAIRNYALPTNRIVCFGDSLTYGSGLRREAAYPARLAELL